ncbi:MAG: penicillin-binding transpeptidase domain-containing protein [Defluviitaleaceae bacterium]|nr:penicillin-binding transpeptidase domain-containing protein [Defluviitaleaceae bacterium]
MKELHKRIGHILWVFAVLFAIMGGYLVYVAAFEADDFIANPFNARVNIGDEGVKRGSIYDANGVIIVESVAVDGAYVRRYPLGPVFAHTAGHSGMSKAGLELTRNFTMYQLRWELVQRARHAIFGDELVANSIVTTFDASLQQMIFDYLDGTNSRGAVAVINPSTGAVLAMVSTPSFHPEYIGENWGELVADRAASPLINRATQGLYPPGSTFKIITAMAALEQDPALLDFVFECTGHATFGANTIQCWGGTAHGRVNMTRAMAVSCNGYFAVLAEKIGAQPIIDAAEGVFFNSTIPFELANNDSQFPMSVEPTMSELIETAIGQGRTTTTPLNMAVLAGAIANGGVAMEPYMVDRVINAAGNTINATSPRMLGRVMPPEMSVVLDQMLIEAVADGTGTPAAVAGLQTAGKTGTAQNETGVDHSWFVGYATADSPTVALAIIIENTGGGTRASRLAGRIFEHMMIDQ